MADPLGFAVLGVGGFTIGFLIGKALRFVAKIGMYVVGLYLASLVILASMGIIIINWDALENLTVSVVDFLVSLTKSDVVSSTGAFGVSGFLGAIYGALKGEVHPVQNYKFFRRLR